MWISLSVCIAVCYELVISLFTMHNLTTCSYNALSQPVLTMHTLTACSYNAHSHSLFYNAHSHNLFYNAHSHNLFSQQTTN